MLRGQQENLAMGDEIKTTNLKIVQSYAAFQDLLSFPHRSTDDFSVLESLGDAMKQMAESTAPKSKVKCSERMSVPSVDESRKSLYHLEEGDQVLGGKVLYDQDKDEQLQRFCKAMPKDLRW